jgi:hypothetical protein
VVMKMENISDVRTVGWPYKISGSAMVRENQQSSQNEEPDDAADAEFMFMPTPPPVWPRVWPGL